jgi:hypothetical protein
MALNRPSSSLVVRMAKSHEAAWGRMGAKHFCVTRAMQQVVNPPGPISISHFRNPSHL